MSFTNIPYAEPPIGKRRFQKPEAVHPWEEIYNATGVKKKCLQDPLLQVGMVSGSEDCLVLNVYTPTMSKTPLKLLPVLFWIHGGAFQFGSGMNMIGVGPFDEYEPGFFIEENIVVVTTNYRLGVLGFLTTQDGVIPANLGLRDQNLALKWIQENIDLFGGNPNDIIMAGESVGSCSTCYHCFPMGQNAFTVGRKLGLDLDESSNYTSAILLELLQNTPVSSLFRAAGVSFFTRCKLFLAQLTNPSKITVKSAKNVAMTTLYKFISLSKQLETRYSPLKSDDGYVTAKWSPVFAEDFYPKEPMDDAIDEGRFRKVPLLFGFNSEECLSPVFLKSLQHIKRKARRWDQDTSKMLDITINIRERSMAAEDIKTIYTNRSFSEDIAAVVKFCTDDEFTLPIGRHAESASRHGIPVYMYTMDYKFLPHFVPVGEALLPNFGLIVQRMVKLMSNFVRYKKPIVEADVLFEYLEWPEFNSKDLKYMRIDTDLKVLSNVRNYSAKRADFDLTVTLRSPRNSRLKGQCRNSHHGRTYSAFTGIPYADPPIGKRRLQKPKPRRPWKGTYHATKEDIVCVQETIFSSDVGFGSEDCLVLNIYTPMIPRNSSILLPVLFWIHGGGFQFGSAMYMLGFGSFAEYDPSFLVDEDIVVVTANYRLGALGFLTTEDEVIPANLGLRDQNLALKWVQENIDLFGGNPRDIVISGESAGAASVCYHLLSNGPEIKAVTGAILISGTCIAPWAINKDARAKAFDVGKKSGNCYTSDNNNSATLLRQLQSLPVNTFFDLTKGRFHKVPLLFGFNSEECLSPIFLEFLPQARIKAKVWDQDSSNMIETILNTRDRLQASKDIKALYTDKRFQEDIAALVKYCTDDQLILPIVRHAESVSKYDVPVHMYMMAFQFLPHFTPGVEGVGHGEDLFLFWDTLLTKILKLLVDDYRLIKPIAGKDELFQNLEWPKFESRSLQYMRVDTHMAVRSDPRNYSAKRIVWDKHLQKPISYFEIFLIFNKCIILKFYLYWRMKEFCTDQNFRFLFTMLSVILFNGFINSSIIISTYTLKNNVRFRMFLYIY
nr:unnamed protein product [Callosobruchus analis]